MKLIILEMDVEIDKWEEFDNDIVKRVKNMFSMVFFMYLFIRGEGLFKIIQDFFIQVEYFFEEGIKLYKIVRDFSDKVMVNWMLVYQYLIDDNIVNNRNVLLFFLIDFIERCLLDF